MQSSLRATMQKGLVSQLRQQSIRAASTVSNPADAVFSGANAQYIDMMYQKWTVDPSSIHASWDAFFRTGSYVAPGVVPGVAAVASSNIGAASVATGSADPTIGAVVELIGAFQRNGHAIANLDPLGFEKSRGDHPELTPEYYGLTDLNKTYDLSPYAKTVGSIATKGPMTLGQIIDTLKATYANTVGIEFSHAATDAEIQFFRDNIETLNKPVAKDYQLTLLTRLAYATQFESFLKSKYNVKRFGIEGNESTIVALREILRVSSDNGADTAVFGMPHRGRLNVLVNVVGKPLEIMFSEFAGNTDGVDAHNKTDGTFGVDQEFYPLSGDVKYHHGWSKTNTLGNGKEMTCTLLPNPSHLETVNPVSQGKTRAKQFFKGDQDGSKVINIQLHGDASFSGQGVVFESLAMHGLSDYNVGGTVHVVVNNQIGFTTNPKKSRSGPYATDIAKAFQVPVIHVNAADVEAVAKAAKLAAEYRAKFKKDIVMDIIGWRLNGHNELDQPSFTQPIMYKKIATLPTILQQYQAALQKSGVSEAEINQVLSKVDNTLREKFEISRTYTEKPNATQFLTEQWSKIASGLTPLVAESTGVDANLLKTIGTQISAIPEDIELHRGIANAYRDKKAAIEANEGFDWATAEALAFGSLLAEGYPVRIAGQDAERGTFSHRHAVVHDQPTGREYTPLNNLKLDGVNPAKFTVVNSLLSEYAALGFEYGYSLEHPDQLVLWEGQFGDFVNGAQIMLDNYISSGEFKWNRQSGLVMLLPHGMEGQGPEHSNAYPLRFLQSCNDDPYYFPRTEEEKKVYVQRNNWQVLNMTSAANYFHALRRQVKRNIRKPLVVMSPKSLLRHRGAAASLEDLKEGTEFKPVLGDAHVNPANVKKHIVCSGKVYFDIVDKLEKAGVRDEVAVTRLEQLAPFPFHELEAEDAKYKNAQIVWVQEEHMNFGPYSYVAPRIVTATAKNRDIAMVPYIGRPPAAAPACGASQIHNAELNNFLEEITKF